MSFLLTLGLCFAGLGALAVAGVASELIDIWRHPQ